MTTLDQCCWICLIGILVGFIAEGKDDGPPPVDSLLTRLDQVIHDGFISIPDDLINECQSALILWTNHGDKVHIHPASTSQDHANADRLLEKLRVTHLALGGKTDDRQGFIRDAFTLEEQFLVIAVQYYSFIRYYDHSSEADDFCKFIEWNVYPNDYDDGFVPQYHLERNGTDPSGYVYVLGRKRTPKSHEVLVNFGNDCPSYMKLKGLIIGDLTGDILPDTTTPSAEL